MKAPQIIMIILLTIEFFSHILRMTLIERSTAKMGTTIFTAVLRVVTVTGLLYWGDFWT